MRLINLVTFDLHIYSLNSVSYKISSSNKIPKQNIRGCSGSREDRHSVGRTTEFTIVLAVSGDWWYVLQVF